MHSFVNNCQLLKLVASLSLVTTEKQGGPDNESIIPWHDNYYISGSGHAAGYTSHYYC